MTSRSRVLATIVAIAAILRLWGLSVRQPGIELQEHFAGLAIQAFARGDWNPVDFTHGPLLTYLLRAIDTLAYALGSFDDRLAMLDAFARDPWPFVVTARLVTVGCALASVLVVGRVADRLYGHDAGALAALILATAFVHVRESHHVWVDLPTGFTALLATWAALTVWRHPTRRAVVIAAIAAAATIASSWRGLPIAATALGASLFARPIAGGSRWRNLVLAAVVIVAGIAAFAPHFILRSAEAGSQLALLARVIWAPNPGPTFPLGTFAILAFGSAPLVLAVVGAATLVRRRPGEAAVVLWFPVISGLLLATSSLGYFRYLVTLAPFVALLAGGGLSIIAQSVPASWRRGFTLVVAVAVCLPSTVRAIGDIRLRGVPDTRVLAGAWITRHIPAGTPITLPDLVPYLDPILPPDEGRLTRDFGPLARALQARGLGDPATTWPSQHIGFFGQHPPDWTPATPFVVTARHPAVFRGVSTRDDTIAQLRASNARIVAEFRGAPDVLPAHVVFDAREAESIPLAGFDVIERPGPTITIWKVGP